MIQKNVKVTIREGFASTCNVEILNSFLPDLQLKDTESAIKNKLKKFFLNPEDLHLRQD